MDEYTMEMKWKWYLDMISFPQNGLVSKLFAQVPRPKEAKLRKSLPLWDLAPLHCKLPDLGVKGMYYTRGKAGASILTTDPNVAFITYDPYCYEHDSRKYDSLHDRHLHNYFKSKKVCGFLKKVGILDKENYPKCSIADMNAYRHYLNRIHKDAVKREHGRMIDLANEKLAWKSAQKNVVKQYFKTFTRENGLKRTFQQRKQLARERRAKELEPYQRTKRWDKRLADIVEQAKDNEIMREELITREKKRYQGVLQRGQVNAAKRAMQTLVKMREQKLMRDEKDKRRSQQAKYEEDVKAQTYVFNKAFEQLKKIELTKQICILQDKSMLLTRRRNNLKLQLERKRFAKQLMCRKMLRFEPSLNEANQIDKKKARYERKIRGGVTYILQILGMLESKRRAKDAVSSKISKCKNPLLSKVAHQMIRRAIYFNLDFACRHLVASVVTQCLADNPTNQKTEEMDKNDKFFLSEECLRDAKIITEMEPISFGLVINGVKKIENIDYKSNTSGLTAFLAKKQKLLTTMLYNAKHLFNLVVDKTQLLSTMGNPYQGVPCLKQKIMNARKTMDINDMIDKLMSVLMITDPRVFNSPLSGLGIVANVIAYEKLMKDREIIRVGDSTEDHRSFEVNSPYMWEFVKELYRIMKNEFDILNKEAQEEKENNNQLAEEITSSLSDEENYSDLD